MEPQSGGQPPQSEQPAHRFSTEKLNKIYPSSQPHVSSAQTAGSPANNPSTPALHPQLEDEYKPTGTVAKRVRL